MREDIISTIRKTLHFWRLPNHKMNKCFSTLYVCLSLSESYKSIIATQVSTGHFHF
jgi:hypothetical protein